MLSESHNEPSKEGKESPTINQPTTQKASQEVPTKSIETEPVSKTIGKYNTDHNKKYRLQWWQFWVQVGLFLATTSAFIAAAYYAHIANEQWKTMNNTYNEIKKQTTSAETSAAAAAITAKTAENTFKLNKDSLLKEIQKQTKAMQDSADSTKETVEQSKAVLDANIKASALDQRAWVGVLEPIPPTFKDEFGKPIYVKEGSHVTFGVIISNFGKSPATKVKTIVALKFRPADEEFSPFTFGIIPPKKSGAVIQPQGRFSMPIPIPNPVNANQIAVAKNREKILYLYGTIMYEDIFKKTHLTTFCMYLAPSLDSFNICETYNNVD